MNTFYYIKNHGQSQYLAYFCISRCTLLDKEPCLLSIRGLCPCGRPPRKPLSKLCICDAIKAHTFSYLYLSITHKKRTSPFSLNLFSEVLLVLLDLWWELRDSNPGSLPTTDLQSAPFGHSGKLP